jgi:NitT/TauT family transport system substrate-binding protein
MIRRRVVSAVLVSAVAAASAACGSSSAKPAATTTTTPGTTTTMIVNQASGPNALTTTTLGGVSATGITPERCAANKAAGPITYLSGFDFAAASSIVEVVEAQAKGYFTKMCLDVRLDPSFSTANYPLVAAGKAQFASAGSFTELAQFSAQNGASLVGLTVDGRTAIDTLIAKPDKVTSIANLKGTTIGVKGKMPPSIVAMLAKHGLTEGTDYQTVLLDGYDPKVHISLPGIVAFPGWKSNEVGQLSAAKIPFVTFDPTADGIPGSFGLIYTSKSFLAQHPTAAQDFVRAALKGLADAMANPGEAVNDCVKLINANGNKNFLSPAGELFRWQTESALIKKLTPAGTGYGVPDPAGLAEEIHTYATVGAFGTGNPPNPVGVVDAQVAQSVYGADQQVIWPSA